MTSVSRKALIDWLKSEIRTMRICEGETAYTDLLLLIQSGAFSSTESEGEAERYRTALEKIVNRQGYSYAEGHYMRKIALEALEGSTSEPGEAEKLRNELDYEKAKYDEKLTHIVRLIDVNEQMREALTKAEKFISAIMGFYGEGLAVHNWHQNGDAEPWDNLIDSNMEGDELEVIRRSLADSLSVKGEPGGYIVDVERGRLKQGEQEWHIVPDTLDIPIDVYFDDYGGPKWLVDICTKAQENSSSTSETAVHPTAIDLLQHCVAVMENTLEADFCPHSELHDAIYKVTGFLSGLHSTSETAVQLRPALQWFAEHQEMVLRANDHKGGWNECTDDYLVDRLQEEVKELISAVRGRKARNPELRIRNEAADVANFAMMIADNARLSLPGIKDGREEA